MKVFLSHSIADKDLVTTFKNSCGKHGLQLLVAEHVVSVDNTITDKIESMIMESKVALFLLTTNGNNSKFVQQEIGYVQREKKPALYIVQKGNDVTGFAYGRDFIELDVERPDLAIKKAINRLLQHWNKLKETEKKEKETAGLLIAGLIGLILISD